MLHLKATDDLRRVLDNTDLAYDDEGDVLHIATDTPDETLRTLRTMVAFLESMNGEEPEGPM